MFTIKIQHKVMFSFWLMLRASFVGWNAKKCEKLKENHGIVVHPFGQWWVYSTGSRILQSKPSEI